MEAQIPASRVVDIGAVGMTRKVRNERDLTVFSSRTIDIQNSSITDLVNSGC